MSNHSSSIWTGNRLQGSSVGLRVMEYGHFVVSDVVDVVPMSSGRKVAHFMPIIYWIRPRTRTLTMTSSIHVVK